MEPIVVAEFVRQYRESNPPAGSNPLIVFPLLPTLLGALVVTLVARLYNNAVRDSRYPKYW